MKVKSLQRREPFQRELIRANRLASKGRYEDADKLYNELASDLADHPGLFVNSAAGHVAGGDWKGVIAKLDQALRLCANYAPALRLKEKWKARAEKEASAE